MSTEPSTQGNALAGDERGELLHRLAVLKSTRPGGWRAEAKRLCDRLADMDEGRPLPDAGPMRAVNEFDADRPLAGAAGFDDDGQPVPTVDFVYPTDGEPDDDPSHAVEVAREQERKDTLAWVLQVLLDGTPTREQIARRVLTLSYVLGHDESRTRTVRALASACEISPARTQQELNSFRAKILEFSRSSGSGGEQNLDT